ncbi:MAG: carboxymuconolactone decarboxylase family protein [Acidobacteriota bacterium]
MSSLPEPPAMFRKFVDRFPELGQAWQLASQAGTGGPLDSKTMLLVKLAIACGAMREGAVHSAVRKALAQGVTTEEVEQVVPLAAGTLGFPGAVAIFSWIQDELVKQGG